ncbi:putative trichothecene 3-O-acetyltransferase [Thozetella sp. PMI_491]|nr:putative trichothecene 3-O-acetyltransferase [Thozetella sp. PMI_491]
MAARARFEKLPVFPHDHLSLEETTKYALSDIDQQMTSNHTRPCLAYPFSGDKSQLVKNLQLGLQNVLTNIGLVGGELLNEDGLVWVVRKNREPINLHVHHLDEDLEFPPFERLAAQGFPASFFSDNAEVLTPPGSNLAGFRRDDGCPVAVFQVNFLKGGVIMTMALHHMCGDAKSIDHTFTLWAESTRAAAAGSPMPTFAPSFDRTYFNADSAPEGKELESMKSKVRGFTFHPIVTDPSSGALTEPPPPPPIAIVMYHFSAESCAELKRICAPAPESKVKFVSSYDVICALAWRAMTRAKIPYLKPDLETATTEYAHPIDSRGKFGKVSMEYFGNGFIMLPTQPILISELIGDGGIAKSAELVRLSIQSFDAESIPDLLRVRRGIVGKEEMRWIWRPENVIGTSWGGMRAMELYDFGFGLPVSVRLPVPPFEGVVGVLPANMLEGSTGGFDVYVVLESGCQDRLRADPEFAKFCSAIEA